MNKITTYTPTSSHISIEDLRLITRKYLYNQSFSPSSIDLLNEVSRLILRDSELKTIPEFASLGFWLRKANLVKITKTNVQHQYFPLGIVFHICPSNVETLFLYSLSLSILAGNVNLVRISSTNQNSQILKIFNILNIVLEKAEFEFFKDRIIVFTYDHDIEINKTLSVISDARIIWGGNKTIQMFKELPTQPHCKDILFPNRNSLMIFNVEFWISLSENEKLKISKQLYNDIFTFNQKACSSPTLILFISKSIFKADNIIPDLTYYLGKYIKTNNLDDQYNLITLKLNQLFDDVLFNEITKSNALENTSIIFNEIKEKYNTQKDSCGAGYLYYKNIINLHELPDFIDKNTQTLSYLGLSNLQIDEIVQVSNAIGIDRIVPVGDALKFNNIWDGKNLLLELVKIKYKEYTRY